MTRLDSTISTTSNSNSDAALLAMIAHHDVIWDRWECDENFPDELVSEAFELERTIIATPAFTAEGLAGKWRVIQCAEYDDDNGIIETILHLDVERIVETG